jgi:2,3-dihydroxybenzoate decarboxylase
MAGAESVMFNRPNCPIIAVEEHYWDAELAKHFTGSEAGRGGDVQERLFDLGALRLREMDEAASISRFCHTARPLPRNCPSRSLPP